MRVLQAMAGAPVGGAEAFFMRLACALSRSGLDQRVVIRRDAQRAAALAQAGVAPVELRFGGWLDFATGRALGREINSFRPDVVMTWMSRATRHCPRATARRRFVHAARLGGYYDLKYYRHCDHLVGNTRDIVDYAVRGGWPAERVHYLPNFVEAAPAPPVARASLDTPDDAPLLLALGPAAPEQGVRRADPGPGGPAGRASLDRRRGAAGRRAAGAGAPRKRRRPRAVPRLARRCACAARRLRHACLPVAHRAARQCRDRGLGARHAGRRRRCRRPARADRRREKRPFGAGRRCGGAGRARSRACSMIRSLAARLAEGGRAAWRKEFTEEAVAARLARSLRTDRALMCGIAGIMAPTGVAPDLAALDAMQRALAHRGPDGMGRHVAGNVALAHTRLAIIDLATGDQPIGEAGRDGADRQRRDLQLPSSCARRFPMCRSAQRRTASRRCISGALTGQRSSSVCAACTPSRSTIAASGRLLLARDPFGIKPLYYAETPKGFAFASEPQALIAAGLAAPQFAPEARAAVAAAPVHHRPARPSSKPSTACCPARRWWSRAAASSSAIVALPCPTAGRRRSTAEDALAALDAALIDSVERAPARRRALRHVPLGRHRFVGAAGPDGAAERPAGARLHRVVSRHRRGRRARPRPRRRARARRRPCRGAVRRKRFLALLPQVAAAMDDPAADYAALPTYKLARSRRRR